MLARQLTIEELASEIPDGSKVALPPDYAYCALSAVRALIRQQKKGSSSCWGSVIRISSGHADWSRLCGDC